MIEKNIFYFWDNPEKMPKEYKENVEYNQKLNPDHKTHLISDKKASNLIKEHFPELWLYYNKIHIPAVKSDIARIVLIYLHGGWYMDADIKLRKSLSEIIGTKEEQSEKELLLMARTDEKGIARISNMFIGAKKEHPALKNCINALLYNFDNELHKFDVMKGTGPFFLTNTLSAYDDFHSDLKDFLKKCTDSINLKKNLVSKEYLKNYLQNQPQTSTAKLFPENVKQVILTSTTSSWVFQSILGIAPEDGLQRSLARFGNDKNSKIHSLPAFKYFTQTFDAQDEDIKIQNYTSMLIHQGVNFVKRHNLSEIAELISKYPLPPQDHSLYAQIYLAYLNHQNHTDAQKVFQEGSLHCDMHNEIISLLGAFLKELKEINDSKDKRITNLQTQVTNKDKRIANLQTQVTDKDKRITNLQTQVINKDKRIKDLNIAKNKLSLYEKTFSGRTGRFLRVIAFLSPKSRRLLREIERKKK